MIRKVFIFPIVVFALIALYQLFLGDFFHFSLWALVTLVSFLIFFGVIKKNADDKLVPVIQISVMFVAIIIVGTILAYPDMAKVFSRTGEVLIVSFFIGILSLGILIIAKGKD